GKMEITRKRQRTKRVGSRPRSDQARRSERSEQAPAAVEPRAHKEVRRLLLSVGRPEPSPFVPDPFQVEALREILIQDVIVSAPTGSGKTWIAVEATREYLAQARHVWYATPLKALSNSKYEEFGTVFGTDRVGILTGDRKENPDAPLIVGTTEILRNQLYDAMQAGTSLDLDLVILDEAHYLGDPDRGVVWEEVLIYLPGRVRLLLLSATISNPDRIAAWMAQVRGADCKVVKSDERPVPLHILFRAPDGELTPFLQGDRLFPSVAQMVRADRRRHRSSLPAVPDINEIVDTLREFDLLPAIVFLKSRSDCDKALNDLKPSPLDPEEGGFAAAITEMTKLYPELSNQRQLDRLLERRAGSHHAGQLPVWRLVIEKMMTLGHLELIVSTSTVAAGVNFPARTVVIVQSDRYDGASFVDMTATDLHQMTGRAGRRGMDNAGFTLIVPGRHMNLSLIRTLTMSPPEPLRSRIAVNFSMSLNLLLSHDPEGVRELLGLSFASFREDPRKGERTHRRLQLEFRQHLDVLRDLEYVDEQGQPTYDGCWAARLRLDHPLLIAHLIREGALTDLGPEELAAMIAPFVMDKEREVVLSPALWDWTRTLWKKFQRTMRNLKPIAGLMLERGFKVPPVLFWPSASVFMWAKGMQWNDLPANVTADEGDLAMLMLRTADHLRQLISLENEKPKLAETARRAVPLLLRPPVF
ncbi:MAG: DEAD/DEAH box helicase, partial [Pseudomonadota bacterium]